MIDSFLSLYSHEQVDETSKGTLIIKELIRIHQGKTTVETIGEWNHDKIGRSQCFCVIALTKESLRSCENTMFSC